MKRKTITLIVAATALMACSDGRQAQPKGTAIDTVPLLVTQIQQCSRLYTAEQHIHKIITHRDNVKLKGSFMQKDIDMNLPVGSRRIAIPMDATVKAYIDMQHFSEKNIRRDGNRIEIVLPDPTVELTATRINHKDVKKHVSLLRSNFSDEEMVAYQKQGRQAIINAIPQTGIFTMAQAGAANILIPMICQMGFKEEDITITFRKDFTSGDMPLLMQGTHEKR